MRTTIDLPDDIYRQLKARAALEGRTVRETVTEYVVEGLRHTRTSSPGRGRSEPLLILFPDTGKPLPNLSPDDLRAIEEEEDLERVRRSFGR